MRGLLLLLVACDAAPHATIVPDAPGADGPVVPSKCRLEARLAPIIGDATLEDCGHLAAFVDDALFTAARDCVVAAESAHRPYVVQWDAQGNDSHVAYAYVGLDDGGVWTTRWLTYDGDPSGGGADLDGVDVRRCDRHGAVLRCPQHPVSPLRPGVVRGPL